MMSADLRYLHAAGADFSGASLQGADAAGADFTGAKWDGAKVAGSISIRRASTPRRSPLLRTQKARGRAREMTPPPSALASILAAPRSRRSRWRRRRSSGEPPHANARDDYDAIVRASPISCARSKRDRALRRVGVGTPGAISPRTGLIKNSNTTVLNGRPLDRDLARRWERPVRLENDANCFALSEAVDGAGAGARVVFGVILGTGVGGGSSSTARGRRAQQDRRRMGPQSAAVDARGRVSGPPLLLRP